MMELTDDDHSTATDELIRIYEKNAYSEIVSRRPIIN